MNIYDRIGEGYDATRRADRAILDAFSELRRGHYRGTMHPWHYRNRR